MNQRGLAVAVRRLLLWFNQFLSGTYDVITRKRKLDLVHLEFPSSRALLFRSHSPEFFLLLVRDIRALLHCIIVLSLLLALMPPSVDNDSFQNRGSAAERVPCPSPFRKLRRFDRTRSPGENEPFREI